MVQKLNIHATAIIINGHGILLRGVSGAGKSLLALELIARTKTSKRKVVLLADDRVDIIKKHNQIIMQTPLKIAGMIELYGRGIVTRSFEEKAKLDLIVDFVKKLERMPDKESFMCNFEGVEIARCIIPMHNCANLSHQILLIDEALANLPIK